MPFVCFEPNLSYCRRLPDSIGAHVEVAERGMKLQCWFFDQLYTDMYLIGDGTHWKETLEFNICHPTAERKPIFQG